MEQQQYSYRGPLAEFGKSLGKKYADGAQSSLASIIGKSSIAKAPRAPVELVSGTLQASTDALVAVYQDGGSLLDNLSFDPAYVEKQKAIRKNRRITGVAQG
eukprot:CAMPEP_0204379322 /NCGR_PEP_ID=MMETSP0469-20131031/52506_1 /ASSEMBLY_ACC=CAM_ASM_000384 /TAXON_ID=2969 /ORGANISM="Oxyrrhis marina" /LENGTH=101 /DNA_ID=CAMNT_0051370785 /DNA_START=1 /DNA_END=303 /DNA_ORIENTATION=-